MIRSSIIVLLLFLLSGVSGCSLMNAFTPNEIVKHPDAPMLILEAREAWLRVSVYDSENNRLIEYGWIHINDANLKGWSVLKYDWQAFIKRKAESNGENGNE